MSDMDPAKWRHPLALKLYQKLKATHLKWLANNQPDGASVLMNIEALSALIEQILRATDCEHCRRGMALQVISNMTDIIAAVEEEAHAGENPLPGAHVH